MNRKATILIVLSIIIMTLTSSCSSTDSTAQGAKYIAFGAENSNGRTYYFKNDNAELIRVFDQEWDDALDFNCGVGIVRSNDKWGFINEKGEYICSPQWDRFDDFDQTSGLAKVTLDNKSGYINLKGELILPLNWQYDKCKSFSDGLAPIEDPNGSEWGYMDAQGQLVIGYQWSEAYGFNEGLAPVSNYYIGEAEPDDGWAYIDRKGSIVIGYNDWIECSEFRKGIAFVCKYYSADDASDKWGVINTKGEWIVEPYYDFVGGEIQNITSDERPCCLRTNDDEVLTFYMYKNELYYSLSYSGEWDINMPSGKLDLSKPLTIKHFGE